jgi:RNA-directed DNA polymerase
MAEGSIRHPVAGTPQGGIISPLLANVLLTALDERYGRWIPRPHEVPQRAQTRRTMDRHKGLPSFFLVRYADDFVILVIGTQEEAEQEKARLAEFLKERLHLELSVEKTLVTRAEDGFEFLGYRVIKEPSQRTGRPVAKLLIPKGKLQLLRNRIRERTSMATTNQSLEDLLKPLNPLIAGWRNYYRYATGAWKDFARLDWWMGHRLYLWLRKKHPKATVRELYRRYRRRERGVRWTWCEGETWVRRFGQGGTTIYKCRGTRISNGWNEEIDGVRFYEEAARPISGLTWTGALW